MADDLEATIRRAVRGGMVRFSLHENWDNRKPKWAASYLHVEANNIQYVDADDPIDALRLAIRQSENDIRRRKEERAASAGYEARTKEITSLNVRRIERDKAIKASEGTKRRRDIESLA